MNISDKGLDLIKQFEGFRDKAYLDHIGIPTIGYGTIIYPDGTKVRMGDVCIQLQAEEWLLNYLGSTIVKLNALPFNKPLNQNQFDALCSFVYNLGFGALSGSTLYQKAKIDPDDETIYKYDKCNAKRTCEFTKFIKAGKDKNGEPKDSNGLLARRIKEADLYGAI